MSAIQLYKTYIENLTYTPSSGRQLPEVRDNRRYERKGEFLKSNSTSSSRIRSLEKVLLTLYISKWYVLIVHSVLDA